MVKIGDFVTLKITGLYGPIKVAGIVKRILGDHIEVKTQMHGYAIVHEKEIGLIKW